MSASEAYRTIAIAGGGLIGRTLAVVLASQSHLSVRLYAGPEIEADSRASAIAAAGRAMLQRVGVWSMVAENAQPIREMLITDSDSEDVVRPEALSFEGEDGSHAFAHMVPNTVLRDALAARCEALSIEERPDRVTFFTEYAAGVTVESANGAERRASVLVAADGRASRVRSMAGIETVEHRFGQSAIAGTLAHELPHYGRAVQHFMPAGPLAMLPLVGNRSSFVWTERPQFAQSLGDMDPDLAALEIERVFGLGLGRLTVEGPLTVYPLVCQLARRFVDGRIALAGDAAHVIHPLAGQGFNVGLRDVATLAQVLVDASRNGEDLSLALPRYERWRRADATGMALLTGGLNAIFSRRSDVFRAMRSIGLGVINTREDLKALFIREAAGQDGERPRLMRGEAL